MYTNIKMMCLAMLALVSFSCSSNDEDGYIASTLRNHDWKGTITEYYQSRWGITGSEYATVMSFESKDAYYTSGKGYELDYNTASPQQNYAFCTFKWFIVDGDITIIYDDAMWSPVYIVDYQLNGNSFYGYIYDGSNRRIQFDLESTQFADWEYYKKKGYRDITSSYRVSGMPAGSASVASGIFAEKLNNMKKLNFQK